MAEQDTDLGREQQQGPEQEVRPEGPGPSDGDACLDATPQLVLDTDLSVYPLRDPGEDPRWAVRTVKGWIWFTLFCLGFILVMMILGQFYD